VPSWPQFAELLALVVVVAIVNAIVGSNRHGH